MKLFSKIATLALGAAMAVGVGVAVGSKKVGVAKAAEACSFSRSGSTDSVTSGYQMVLTNYKGNADNYQDKNANTGLDIGIKKSSGTIWSTTPSSISLTVKVGGGTKRDPLNNSVTANLIDSNGNAISGTSVTVTTKVETTTGKDYTVSVPVANNASGVMIHHEKEESYNVRIYSISLSYEGEGGGDDPVLQSIAVSGQKTEYNVDDTFVKPTVTATFDKGEPQDVTSSATFTGYNLSVAGNYTVTVSYGGKTTTYDISVIDPTPVGEILYSCDFTEVETHSYTQNKEFTLNSKNWVASVSQVNGGVFYLGCNNTHTAKGILNDNSSFSDVVALLAETDAPYGNSVSTAHAYAMRFENAYDNVGSVEFTWSGGNNAFQVYLFGDRGEGLESIAHTNYATSGQDVAGKVKWTASGYGESFSQFVVVARPGATGSTATQKTLRAATFKIYEGEAEPVDPTKDTLVILLNDATPSPISLPYSNGGLWYANDKDGNDIDAEWLSSNEAVFTMSKNGNNVGVCTPVGPGTANIIAHAEGYNDGVFVLTITKGDLQSVAISGSLTKTTYATTEAWSHDGLTATATYSTGWQEDVSSSATWTYNPSAPVEDLEQVTITATFSGKSDSKSCNISVTPIPSTPISWFYENKSLIDSTETYSIKGTCIGIQGNSYYLQDGEYGMLVYGGSTTPPTGLAVGKKVLVNSKVQFYGPGFEEQIFETSGTPSASILGEGNLPTASIVDTAAGFASANQNTYVTFNGLKSFSWSQAPVFSGTMKDGIGVAEDKNGTSVSVFVSRFIGSTEGTKIVNALAAITEDDTFDVVRSIKAIASGGDNKGKGQVSILSSDQIVVHTPEEDAVQTWIDTYMYMNDSRFDGDGTGLCYSDNIYETAKHALIALGETNVAKFEANAEGKYDAAKARYLEWARICKDNAPFEDNFDFTSLSINLPSYQSNIDSSSSITIIVIVAVTSMTLLGVTLVLRKRKHQ